MYVSKDDLLKVLPPFNNNSIVIEQDQGIHDIIKEVLNAHKFFAIDYDFIYQYFDKGSIRDICKSLFDFCKSNIDYKIESEDKQTTKSPAAMLAMGYGDCKHYAGFIAGVLSAIVRNTGRQINWFYRFANYSIWNSEIEHVFVVVNDRGVEIWIDPVLAFFDSREQKPVSVINKKINNAVMLNRISGFAVGNIADATDNQTIPASIPFDTSYLATNAITTNVNLPVETLADDYYETDVPPNILNDIKMLLYYGIIDQHLNIYNDVYLTILEGLQGQDQIDLSNAYAEFLNAAQTKVVGSVFSSIWGTVKQISLAVPRGAYLSMVSLNVFNMATHLYNCITNPDGSTDQAGIDKLQGVWHKKLSGDTNILLRAIRNGHSKKAILGIGAAPAAAAWAATAAVIIAAMTPIISQVLKSKNQYSALTAQQLAMQPTSTSTSSTNSLTQYLPILLIAGAAYFLLIDKKK